MTKKANAYMAPTIETISLDSVDPVTASGDETNKYPILVAPEGYNVDANWE